MKSDWLTLSAQIIGLVGYGMILVSLFSKTQRAVFLLDLAGCVIVAAHFVMLSAYAGAALSLVYAVKDIIGMFPSRRLKLAAGFGMAALILVAPLILQLSWVDGLAIAGSLVALAARLSPGLTLTLFLIAFSTIFWGLYGAFVGSLSQVLFSCLYFAIAVGRGIQSASRNNGSDTP